MSGSKQRRAIIANSHTWGGPLKIGAEHLAEQFYLDGWEVLYLSSPLSPMHLAHPRSRKQALRKLKMINPIEAENMPGFHLLCPATLVPHVNIFPFNSHALLQNWFHFTAPPLGWRTGRLGFDRPDAILFDNIVYWPFLKKLPGMKIYRIADRIDQFSVVSDAMLEMHREIIRAVDLVVYTARHLEDMLGERTGPSLFLPNGVNHRLFSTECSRPPEYRNIGGPVVLYMGAVENWFDFDAFNEAAKLLPQVKFVIVSPVSSCLQRIVRRPNVHVLGARQHAELPAYAQHADVGIIPFDVNRHSSLLDSVCPLKLFEYMAAGLPVVSYDSLEIRSQKAPISFYSPQRPLWMVIEKVLGKRMTPDKRRELQNFSLQFDWQNRYKALKNRIVSPD